MAEQKRSSFTKFIFENSLSLALFFLFLFSLIGLSLAGFQEYNSEQSEHQQETISFMEYLTSSHFQEAVFENWESEFLQMWAFVLLTIFLRQKGSPESKKLRGEEDVDKGPSYSLLGRNVSFENRSKAFLSFIYGNSLGLALLILFLLSFLMHGISGMQVHNDELLAHGESSLLTLWQYFGSSTFWFESFQNWQSEFLSIGVLIMLSIFLRQKGSPESKPVSDPNSKTGK